MEVPPLELNGFSGNCGSGEVATCVWPAALTPSRRGRVLVVDDDSDLRSVAEVALSEAGFEVQAVGTGRECLVALAEALPDVVLLDINLPDLDGRDICRQLKADDRTAGVAIVHFTGDHISSEEQAYGLESGADGYVVRPLSNHELVARVESILRIKRTEGELRRVSLELRAAAHRLEQSEQRYKSLFEHNPDAVYSLDREGRLLSFNPAGESLLGYPTEELLLLPYQRVFVPEDHERAGQDLALVLAGNSTCSELGIARKDGKRCRAKITSLPIIVDGEIVGAFCITKDVTQKRESEARFRQLAENVEDAFWILDVAASRMLYVNPAFQRMRGHPGESVDPDPSAYLSSVHPQDRERVVKTFSDSPWGMNVEYRVVLPNGSVRWHWARTFPIHDTNHSLYRIGGIARDITERKEAEALIAEQAALLDHTQEAIYVQGLDGFIKFWNPSAERIYGRNAAEMLGTAAFPHALHDTERYEAARRQVLEKGEWIGQLTEEVAPEREITVEGHWTVVRDGEGRPQSILCINTDITERKKLEGQFLRAQRMESIGTLAGGIAHDLNNVLAPIVMSIEFLKLKNHDPASLAVLDTIEASAHRGAEMVQQVLSFARGVEGQRLMVQPKHLMKDIQKIIADAFPKNIEMKLQFPTDLWNVVGDPTQLHQVLLNLSVNARDAMPDGGQITLTAQNISLDDHFAAMHLDATPGPHVVLELTDTGCGIPDKVLEKIFDPFFTTKDVGKGTGLGLSTSQAIIRSHGGFIQARSEPGRGATFKVYLPACADSLDPEHEAVDSTPPRGRGQVILVVDDEASIRSITQQTLEAFGYRVLLAADGVEAVAIYAQKSAEIAAVITDMIMPVMDGPTMIEVLTKLNPAIKVIAASGMNGEKDAARTALARARRFLPKPYTAELMLRLLAEVLEEK